MADFAKFNFQNEDELKEKIAQLGLEIPWEEDLTPLLQNKTVKGKIIANAMAIHPMEGYDANDDGSPSELTWKRYKSFAEGGAGLIWWEATSVVDEGKSNPHQLVINEETKENLANLVQAVNREGINKNGFKPVNILQLNHSGRYSKPLGKNEPLFVFHDRYLDDKVGIAKEDQPVDDQYLKSLIPSFIKAAELARASGFDGVDIKVCHRYLLSEIVAGFTREGFFGGSYANRVRIVEEIVEGIREKVGDDLILTSRLNVFDGIPYPFGWGSKQDDEQKFDLSEPIKLIKSLADKGVEIFSVSLGDPRLKPYMVRPFDRKIVGIDPPEHPLEGVHRHFQLTEAISKEVPEKIVMGAGYSWLRHFFPNIAAGNLKKDRANMVGVGRMAFAYPDFAKDIIGNGCLESKKSCIACSMCSELMIKGGPTGCVIRNRGLYQKLYREKVK